MKRAILVGMGAMIATLAACSSDDNAVKPPSKPDGGSSTTTGTGGGGSGGSGGSGGDAGTGGSAGTGIIVGPGADSGANDSGGCASSTVKGELIPANLLFVIDRSGSMNCNLPPITSSSDCEAKPERADSTKPSKWEIIRDALKSA